MNAGVLARLATPAKDDGSRLSTRPDRVGRGRWLASPQLVTALLLALVAAPASAADRYRNPLPITVPGAGVRVETFADPAVVEAPEAPTTPTRRATRYGRDRDAAGALRPAACRSPARPTSSTGGTRARRSATRPAGPAPTRRGRRTSAPGRALPPVLHGHRHRGRGERRAGLRRRLGDRRRHGDTPTGPWTDAAGRWWRRGGAARGATSSGRSTPR